MSRIVTTLTITSLFLALPALACAGSNMQPGQWEITSSIDLPGMSFSMPASKNMQCISGDEPIPQAQQQSDKCRLVENEIDGDRVSWELHCESDGGTLTSRGEIVYQGDRFEGTVVSQGGRLQGGITQRMTGKRVGDCR